MLRTRVRIIDVIRSFPFLYVLIFASLSAAPFFWSSASSTYQYIGADDYSAPITSLISFHYSIYPYDHLNGAGADLPFLVAMLPVYVFFYVMSWLGATQLFATILLISLQIFVAELAFFYSSKYFITRKLQLSNNYIAACALGAITYGFSPYFIAEIIPGHGMALFLYALFPLIIRYWDALLIADKLDYAAATSLFVMLAICSPSFANIGNLYVFFIATAIYTLSIAMADRPIFWRTNLRFAFLIALAVFSNLWWLLPHLYNLSSYIAISASQGGEMNNLVAYASSYASIANIFQGRPEGLMYLTGIIKNDYYVNMFHSLIFLVITLLVIYTAFNKQRQVYVLLLAALFSIMFLKGIQEPFPSLFFWAYDNVPGFQVMRRPTSKFYGFFLYFFLAIATLGLAIAINKFANKKWVQYLFLGLGCVATSYMVSIFALTPSMKAYNIPERYSEARDYLMRDHVERVLILPVVSGWRPHYNIGMNFYTGIDFVDEYFRFPKINASSSLLAVNENYFRPTNELIQLLHANNSICEKSRTLGISHIIVRDDLERSQVEINPTRTAEILDKHPDIVQKTNFSDPSGARLIVYKLNANCTSHLINLDGSLSSFSYELLNPGKIAVNIKGLQGPAKLNLRNNYNENWDVHVGDSNIFTIKEADNWKSSVAIAYNEPEAMKLSFNEIKYLFMKSPFKNSHEVSSQYANTWTIDPALLENVGRDSSTTPNADGSVNIKLVLYYRPQAYLLLGIVMSLVSLIALLLLRIRNAKCEQCKQTTNATQTQFL